MCVANSSYKSKIRNGLGIVNNLKGFCHMLLDRLRFWQVLLRIPCFPRNDDAIRPRNDYDGIIIHNNLRR
ncbi:MAG: hypothetical protein CR217_11550 [Beijerinckiaceae bacterium]|nr:MAG: hypothetical protein CR217_11550 [Beijerinckiaceae bacterium]